MSDGSLSSVQGAKGGHKRDQWTKSFDFLFAAIGSSVGLGNIWRFPYLCFKNGGGAFLIPYALFSITIATPAIILETSMGQRVRRGAMQSWKIVPIFKGLPIAQLLIVIYSALCYPIVLAWDAKYLVHSFQAVLPWSTCNNGWNSPQCLTVSDLGNLSATHGSVNANATHNVSQWRSSTNEYFAKEVLHVSSGLDKQGSLVGELAVYLLALWVIFYLCMIKGVKTTAKIVYVTASLPILLILVILVRGVTLEGAAEGLRYFLIPDLEKLKNPEVWTSACAQLIYSYSVGGLSMVTFSSYNKPHHNFWRDAILIASMNGVVSFLSGVAVFSSLGYMANYQNTTVEAVAKSGPGLAFIAYPEIITLLPVPQLWSVIFFLNILFLGIDTQFAILEAFMAVLYDNFSFFRYWNKSTRAVCYVTMFLLSLTMVTEILNNYATTGWCVFLTIACECVALGWLYGFDSYWEEIKWMIGDRMGRLWLKFSWKYFSPIVCIVMAIYAMSQHRALMYGDYLYPAWGQAIAHMVAVSSIMFIPIFAIYLLVKTYRNKGNYTKLRRHSLSEMYNITEKDTKLMAESGF